jgi:sarcosine oxidase gamma subunit
MARLCAIDLDPHVRPNGAALRTSVASLAVDVVRDDVDGDHALLLGCERSSGRYLWDVLLDAGVEDGVEVTGFHGPLT